MSLSYFFIGTPIAGNIIKVKLLFRSTGIALFTLTIV